MTKEQLKQYIAEEYGAEGERLWAKYPGYEVFRHVGNRKWFAILMDVPKEKLGISPSGGAGNEVVDVLDVKCDVVFAGSFLSEGGFYPAYHMNKNKWISIDIANVAEDKIKMFLDMSYNLTATKARKGKD